MKANYKKHQVDSLLKSRNGKQAIIDECLKVCENYEILFLYAMNHDEKDPFGKKRLKRVYKKMVEARKTLSDFYFSELNNDKQIDLFAMKQELERKGIAPEQLEGEWRYMDKSVFKNKVKIEIFNDNFQNFKRLNNSIQ